MRCSAGAGLLVWLVASAMTGRSDAWFVSDDEEGVKSTSSSTAAATVASTKAPLRPKGGKVLEASPEHISLLMREFRNGAAATSATAATVSKVLAASAAPTAVHVTRQVWDDLPGWLPAGVRAEFLKDNHEFLRSLKASTTAPSASVHETKDYWDRLPGWLPARVRQEFLSDNSEFLRRRSHKEAATASPTAVQVTKNYWTDLPGWLPARVRQEFLRDNGEYLRMRGLAPSTVAPTAAHVTQDFWDELPGWLPARVRQEFLRENGQSRRLRTPTTTKATPSIVKATVAPAASPTEATLPMWIVHLLKAMSSPKPSTATPTLTALARLRLEKGEGQKGRSLGSLSQATSTATPTPTTTSEPAPTRAPLTLSSAARLPQKCSRQVNWLDQPKCSASRSKWTFNLVTLRCEWFVYYGCQLNNGNVFNSRRDCENYCIQGVINPCESVKCVPVYSLYQSDCFLLNDTACINSILQQYSSIGSPAVRMEIAREQILLFCQPPVARCLNTGINARLPSYESPPTVDDLLSASPPHCFLPPDRGSCKPGQRGRMSRVYYYSQRHNQCKFMMHFGCGGNPNRFANQADCYNNCGI